MTRLEAEAYAIEMVQKHGAKLAMERINKLYQASTCHITGRYYTRAYNYIKDRKAYIEKPITEWPKA